VSEEQYSRKCSLFVSGRGQESLDLSRLRITFLIKKTDSQQPNEAEIRIWNASEETANRVKKEFDKITLQAGYDQNFAVIFEGNIKESQYGRENGTDTYLEIRAADGDKDYNFAIINKTLAAGATQKDIINSSLATMPDTQSGNIANLGSSRLPRGKVMYGNSRKFIRRSAMNSDASWSIQDGKLQIVKLRSLLPTQAVVLNSQTGLIDTPEQTTKGIKARCLLNPMLKIAGRVKIDSSAIRLASLGRDKANEKKEKPVSLSVDGIYRLLKVDFIGDTRGNDWFCDLTCIDVDASAPKGSEVDLI
jgi:hypothetical protein